MKTSSALWQARMLLGLAVVALLTAAAIPVRASDETLPEVMVVEEVAGRRLTAPVNLSFLGMEGVEGLNPQLPLDVTSFPLNAPAIRPGGDNTLGLPGIITIDRRPRVGTWAEVNEHLSTSASGKIFGMVEIVTYVGETEIDRQEVPVKGGRSFVNLSQRIRLLGSEGVSPWINEIKPGFTDVLNVEIAGPANRPLDGWRLIAYDGTTGLQYAEVNLSGVIPDQRLGYGTRAFSILRLENGIPDGIALVDSDGEVVLFLSYGGSTGFAAADGPARNAVSEHIGDFGILNDDESIQLIGDGTRFGDFDGWVKTSPPSFNALNADQAILIENEVNSVSRVRLAVNCGMFDSDKRQAYRFRLVARNLLEATENRDGRTVGFGQDPELEGRVLVSIPGLHAGVSAVSIQEILPAGFMWYVDANSMRFNIDRGWFRGDGAVHSKSLSDVGPGSGDFIRANLSWYNPNTLPWGRTNSSGRVRATNGTVFRFNRSGIHQVTRESAVSASTSLASLLTVGVFRLKVQTTPGARVLERLDGTLREVQKIPPDIDDDDLPIVPGF